MHEFSNLLLRLKPTSNLNTVSRTSQRNKRHVLLEIIVVVWNHSVSLGMFLHLSFPFLLGSVYVCRSFGKESIGGWRCCLLQGRVSCGTLAQHSLFCFKGIGMEQVSVGLVHVQLCLYLLWSYSLEAKAKLTSIQTLCLLNFLSRP